MTLDFSQLTVLHQSVSTSVEFFGDTKLYVVGGAVRDCLLGVNTPPTDIDLTCRGDPNQLREQMDYDEATISRFRTEKYGTITWIPKENEGSTGDIYYELTPFRAEGDYTDSRHPDHVTRSDSLISDSARRDFTINALYRTPHDDTISGYSASSSRKSDPLINALTKHYPVYLADQGLVILTNHDQIQTYVASQALPHDCVFIGCDQPTDQVSHVLIDPQGGLLDLISRTIRTVGDPAMRYQEDALRLMRALRFANSLNQLLPDLSQQNSGFDLEKKTWDQLCKNAHRIDQVASERHYQELMKVFTAANPFGYIATLKTSGILQILFPALYNTINNHQPTRHHALDTYSHTLMVLYHLQQRVSDPLVRFATLYHDVGKPEQYAFMEAAKAVNPNNPDREGFRHHAEISVDLAQYDFQALSFPKASLQKICWYIKRHHRPGEILDSAVRKRDMKLRKLISEGGVQETIWLIDIAIADRLGQYNPLQPPAIQELLDMQERVRALYEAEGRFTKKNLVIDGRWIMQEFGLTPGPQIGEIIDRTFEWVLGDVKGRNTEKQIKLLVKGLIK